jgi:hypothetical protein
LGFSFIKVVLTQLENVMVASIFPMDTSSEFSAFELLNLYAVFKGVLMSTVGGSQIPLAWLSKDMQQIANTNSRAGEQMICFIRFAMHR